MRVAPAPTKARGAFRNHHLQDDEKTGCPEKAFATMRAAFALQGHRLERTFHGVNLEPSYYCERWGMVRYLPTLHDAAKFLAQIGGRP